MFKKICTLLKKANKEETISVEACIRRSRMTLILINNNVLKYLTPVKKGIKDAKKKVE